MSTPLKIAYLEISPRMTGKTTRLCRVATELSSQRKPVVYVCIPALAEGLRAEMPAVTVLADGEPLPLGIDADGAFWFYDEFDSLKSTVLREGAYYATTAARLRRAGIDTPENDLLMALLDANGNRHERHLWPFDPGEFVSVHRATMAPDTFRLNMLGAFQS